MWRCSRVFPNLCEATQSVSLALTLIAHLVRNGGLVARITCRDCGPVGLRNEGLAFELRNGEVTRMAPTGLQEVLASAVFTTGDFELDRLLETAREKFLNRSLDVRKEGLEKLWDAWERLKTMEPGKDKTAQVKAILDKAATEPVLRERLELEARELNFIGNNLMIRHTEVGKPSIVESAQIDYLFHRMFAIVRLLLKSSGRGG